MRVAPAKYVADKHTYVCEVCHDEFFPEAEGGICLPERLSCPNECGLVEDNEELRDEINRRIAHAERRAYTCNYMSANTERARFEGEQRVLKDLRAWLDARA